VNVNHVIEVKNSFFLFLLHFFCVPLSPLTILPTFFLSLSTCYSDPILHSWPRGHDSHTSAAENLDDSSFFSQSVSAKEGEENEPFGDRNFDNTYGSKL